MKKIIIGLIVLVLVAVGWAAISGGSASANTNEECVPTEPWTEVIEHPEVSHVVHHDAVTHEETVIDQEAQHYSWTGGKRLITDPPTEIPPSDNWQANTTQEPHKNATWVNANLHYTAQSHGFASWFYWSPEISHVETIVDEEAWDETIVDEEAWTEVVEHPGTQCPDPHDTPLQPDPIVTQTSSTSYECGDDTQTTTTVTTTTEYVWNEETEEWELGEPVEETVTETKDVKVVPCQDPENPDIEIPTGNQEIVSQTFDADGKLIAQKVAEPMDPAAKQEGM